MAICVLSNNYSCPLAFPPTPCVRIRSRPHRVVAKCIQKTVDALETETPRRSANYAPSICDNDFLQSLNSRYGEGKYTKQAERLKDYVRSLLVKEESDASESLELIDTLERLGVGHLFEEEFKNVIEKRVLDQREKDDLYYTALRFRILRQHGYMIPQDELTPYLDKRTGAFMDALKEDTKAILSLYDASYLSMDGETLLDDARSFSTKHLREYLIARNSDTELHNLVKHGVELPHYLRTPKLDARWFINEYERKKKKNPKLLELAKLVYNISQAGYHSGVKSTSKWWKDQGLAELLPFTRDRLSECLLWSLGHCSEPQHSLAIEGMTKVNQFVSTIDDIYDIFGTIEELELFTHAIDRWDLRALEELPEYMRPCFLSLFNFVCEIEYNSLKQQGCNVLPILSKRWADLCKAYLVEAKWFHKRYTPSFDEYMDNAWVTISVAAVASNMFVLTNQKMTKEKLALIENIGELLHTFAYAFRLIDDLGTAKDELARGDVPKAVQCYMHEKGVSEEAAVGHVKNLINESWKKLNKHLILGSPFPRDFVRATMNFLKTAEWYYLHGDGFGGSGRARTLEMFNSVFVEPIPLGTHSEHTLS